MIIALQFLILSLTCIPKNAYSITTIAILYNPYTIYPSSCHLVCDASIRVIQLPNTTCVNRY